MMAEGTVGDLPADLVDWLDERADATGRDRAEVLERAVAAYRLVSRSDGALENGRGEIDAADLETATTFADDIVQLADRLDDLDRRLDDLAGLDDRLDDLDDRSADLDDRVGSLDGEVHSLRSEVADLRADLEGNVQDLRERVVQVLRTAESKADTDHDHEALESDLDAVADDLETVEADLSTLETRVDEGFDNFEAVLADLDGRAEDLSEKAQKLAHAVVDLRGRVADLEAADARRSAVEELQAQANRMGVAVANCEECGGAVRVGLLASPVCPHCTSPLEGIVPARGFFGSPQLSVGDRPALEQGTVEDDPESVFEEDHD